jgi:uncharacterized surface protein with fasciclin (FAS1) repeats
MSRYGALRRAVALAVPITLGAWAAQAADLVETAEQTGRFHGFLQLLDAANMVETLKGERPFTVFAPTDEAIGQLPLGMLDQLLAGENRKPLEAIVQSHIVADAAIPAEELLGRALEVATLGGAIAIDGTSAIIMLVPIEVTITEVEAQAVVAPNSMVTPVSAIVVKAPHAFADADLAIQARRELMGVATVVEPDIEADNGVIHGIDLVLLPQDVLWSF